MGRGAGKSPNKLKEAKKNANGEIINWDSSWSNAGYLRMLVEKGEVDGMTAGQVQKHFPQFCEYSNKPLTGGLKTARDSFSKEWELVQGEGSAGMGFISTKAHPRVQIFFSHHVFLFFFCY
jgi:hypothetical protein